MSNQKKLDELEFEIPAAEEQTPLFSGSEQVTMQTSQKTPWNPQPDPTSAHITDKNGNAFQHQAIICKFHILYYNVCNRYAGYEKRQTIENPGRTEF